MRALSVVRSLHGHIRLFGFAILALIAIAFRASAAECPYLYGIHDHDPAPTEYLDHIKAGVSGGWVTATVAVGHNPADTSGVDFTAFSTQGHTVVCRINNGYSSEGTIPLPQHYADFAQRCANFVQNSPGCEIWLIGNETNLAVEWPPDGTHKPYVSPQDYANCFRQAYDAIKAVRPAHKVICQAIAPWGGPYGPGTVYGYTHDGNPLCWVDYMSQMLTAIKSSGGIDGIAVHVGSRGYTYGDIHSTQQVSVCGKNLYWSFYVYKDWIDYGIPPDLYHLPLYVTECNGMYYWKGGHPEDPSSHYEPGWMQEIYAEIDRHNQSAKATGKPIFRCVNMYRWCAYCDDWNIDGASNPYKAQILSDLDAAVAQAYQWPESGVIVDNSDAGFSVVSGTWSTGTTAADKYGADYRRNDAGTGADVVRWTPDLLQAGNYEVSVWYPEGANRASNSPFTVVHKDGAQTFPVNQTTNGGQWNVLGTFPFFAGQTGYVSLSDNAEASKVVIADAVRWVYKSPLQLPGTIAGYVRDRNGTGLSGATVATATGGYSTTSGANGIYTIGGVTPGTYTVTASKLGYCYQTVSGVTVPSGGTVNQDFSLTIIGGNLLINGDFEGGFQANGVANYWTSWISAWSNPITFADSTSVVRAGGHAQQWGRPDGFRVHGGICQSVGVTPGRQYVVAGWIRFQATDPGAWAEIGYDLTGQTSNGEAATVQYTKLESGGQNTWLYYSGIVTATTSQLAIFFKFGQYDEGGSGPSWAYADDASISEVPTSPIMQSVGDDGVYQTSSTSIHGTWSASDPESGILGYACAISTAPDIYGIITNGNWLWVGTATQYTRTGLSLANGQIYYVLAKARNPHNQWSSVMASDGIRVVESVSDLAEAKKRPDGRWVEVGDLICTLPTTSSRMGVRQAGQFVGIKLTEGSGSLPSVSAGTQLAVMGRLATSGDTRELTDVYVTTGGNPGAPKPVYLAGREVGGSDFFYDAGPPVQGQKGTPWGTGPNNVGLTATVLGRVTGLGTGKFYISDGCDIVGGLPVKYVAGITPPSVDQYVKVTGLVEADGMLALRQTDISIVE